MTTQTPSPTDAPIADLQAWLLALKCPCIDAPSGMCHECFMWQGHAEDCRTCNATGLAFPGLSRECPNEWHSNWRWRIAHLNCEGHCTDGRVPEFTLEAVLETLRGMGGYFSIRAEVVHTIYRLREWQQPWTTEAELTDALTRALAAAVQADGSKT